MITNFLTKVSVAAIGSIAFAAVSSTASHAAVLGGYDFGSNPGGGFSRAPTVVDPSFSFSTFSGIDVTNVNGISGNPPGGGAISSQDWPNAIDLSKYYEFTITPLSGVTSYFLDSLSFDARRGGNGAQSIQIGTSFDNYANPVATFLNQVTNNGWTNFSAPLSLGALTSPVTFRIYGYNATSNNGNASQFSLDNVSLGGGINPIPTPALLPGLFALGAGALRKRKQRLAGAIA
jgi:hypothetical protein